MNEHKNYKDYLDKTFLEELNYKIWTTKGSRFNANKRLLRVSKLSNLANSMLSVYLIAIGLLSVYNIYNNGFMTQNVLPYLMTCISILLLLLTQIENSKNYQLKAKEFHTCGIELSKIYNKLRVFKTLKEDSSKKEKENFAIEISTEYEAILEKYENHDPIDFDLFKTRNAGYFELNKIECYWIKLRFYFKSQFGFHFLIVIPPILIIFLIMKK
jgi:hypothetical protein